MKKTTVALILIACLLAAGAAWVYATYYAQIDTSGTYEGNLEISPTSIDWGNTIKNENITRNVNITNHGNTATLNFSYIEPSQLNTSLICDAQDYVLAKGETVQANFTLTIFNGTAGTFDFTIYVEAQQT